MMLLSEFEQGPINSRVFRLQDNTYQVLVFNATTGKEVAEFFNNYDIACNHAENATVQLNG